MYIKKIIFNFLFYILKNGDFEHFCIQLERYFMF